MAYKTFCENRAESVLLGEALIERGYSDEGRRIKACCTEGVTLTCACKKISVSSNPCKYGVCPTCLKVRRGVFRRRYLPVVRSFGLPRTYTAKGLRLVTLSLRNEKDLNLGMLRLKESFKRFRGKKYVKDRVFGHLTVFEYKRGRDGLWNVHVHSLMYSRFLNNIPSPRFNGDSELVWNWKQASYSSDAYVHISKCRSGYTHHGALNYLLKYIGKGSESESLEDSLEIFEMTRDKRVVVNGGCMVTTRHFVIQKKLDKVVCPDCGFSFMFGISEEYRYNHLDVLDPPDNAFEPDVKKKNRNYHNDLNDFKVLANAKPLD